MLKKIFCFSGFFYFIISSVHAVDLSKVDFKYLYDPTEIITIKTSNSCQNDTVKLLASIHFASKGKITLLNQVSFLGQSSFSSPDHDELVPLSLVSDTVGNTIYIEADLLVLNSYNYIVLDLVALGKHYYSELEINEAEHFPCPSFIAHSKSSQQRRIAMATPMSDTLLFKDASEDVQQWFVYQYTSTFSSSRPPMVTASPAVNKSFDIDAIYSTDHLPIGEPNSLYFVQTDTTGNSGISFLSVKSTFPRLVTPEELIEPLIYISTKSEYEKLSNSTEKRSSFENFWLNRARQDQAKKAIRQYYKNIQQANLLFTSYKIGWKTDQGMILTIYGPPNQVNRKAKAETWVYFKSEGTLTYTFDKVPNLFSRFHYNLQRKKEYYKDWFKEVARWRKAKI